MQSSYKKNKKKTSIDKSLVIWNISKYEFVFHNTKIPQVRDVIGFRLITESHDLEKLFRLWLIFYSM